MKEAIVIERVEYDVECPYCGHEEEDCDPDYIWECPNCKKKSKKR